MQHRQAILQGLLALTLCLPAAAQATWHVDRNAQAPGLGTADQPFRTLRYAAAYCLGRIGSPAASPAVERLAKLAEADDPMLATVAIWAALQIEPDNQSRFEQAIPMLTTALEAEMQTVRLEAAIALGDLGSRAKTAIPALELLAEDDPIRGIRDAARQSLRKIRGS